jgi:hypothetical protein
VTDPLQALRPEPAKLFFPRVVYAVVIFSVKEGFSGPFLAYYLWKG